MKKLMLVMLVGLMIIGLGSGQLESLGTFKQNSEVRIAQVCQDATYINISSVSYPNGTVAVSNIEMTSAGSGEYNYTFTDTSLLGRYDVRGISDGCEKTFATYFEITPSGASGTENIIFFVFVIVLLYGINLLGFFGKNEIMTILGGMALIFLGVYLIRNGVIIYRDNLTNYLAYITTAWGFVSAIWASISLMQDL